MAERSDIESTLSGALDIGRFRDYGPNGLSIEGKSKVRTTVSRVIMSRARIAAPIET